VTRILVCASTFPLAEDDGSPRFVYDLCQALARNAEVAVLAPGAPGARPRERMGLVDVERFSYFLPRSAQQLAYGAGMPDNLRRSKLAKLQALTFVLAQARAIRRVVSARGIDTVHSHWMLPQGLSAAIARGRRARFRHVVTLHGGDSYLLRRLAPGQALARYILRRTDQVVAVSSNVSANLDATLGVRSDVAIQPMGVHVARFRQGAIAESPFPDGFLLVIARLIKIKGVDVLLRALVQVRERHPEVGLLIVGDGPEATPLIGLVHELGLDEAVQFVGTRPHQAIAALLRGCRAAIVPSIVDADGRAEGMPTVVAEALAAGARVVASRVGGIPDVIQHERNGWLAEPGSPEDLAEKISAALTTERPHPIDAAAREAAEALDWSCIAEAYLGYTRDASG
jgi:glycosyltransferase involved in cell wall biosynthesis